MTSTFSDTGREGAIHDYVQSCRPYLLDLTPDQQDQLEEDIRQIVGEVAMELDGHPDDLVGPPLRFVAELRTAAGLSPQLPPAQSPQAPTPLGSILGLTRWIRRTAAPWVLTLAKDLRPAGWVLRGVGLAFLMGAHRSPVLGIPMTIGAVVASVEIGRKHLTGRRQRLAIAVASIAAAIAFVIAAVGSSDPFRASSPLSVTDEAQIYDDFQMTTATTVVSQLIDDTTTDGMAPFLNEPTRSTITFLTHTDAPMTEPISTSTQAHEVLNQIEAQGFVIGSVSLAVQSYNTEGTGLDLDQANNRFQTFDEAHRFVDEFFATP